MKRARKARAEDRRGLVAERAARQNKQREQEQEAEERQPGQQAVRGPLGAGHGRGPGPEAVREALRGLVRARVEPQRAVVAPQHVCQKARERPLLAPRAPRRLRPAVGAQEGVGGEAGEAARNEQREGARAQQRVSASGCSGGQRSG